MTMRYEILKGASTTLTATVQDNGTVVIDRHGIEDNDGCIVIRQLGIFSSQELYEQTIRSKNPTEPETPGIKWTVPSARNEFNAIVSYIHTKQRKQKIVVSDDRRYEILSAFYRSGLTAAEFYDKYRDRPVGFSLEVSRSTFYRWLKMDQNITGKIIPISKYR
jgi:hypothetical protein